VTETAKKLARCGIKISHGATLKNRTVAVHFISPWQFRKPHRAVFSYLTVRFFKEKTLPLQ